MKKKSKSVATSIPRATFSRLVRDIAGKHAHKSDAKWSAEALRGLHEEAELFIQEHFRDARQLSERFKHRTVGIRHFNNGKAESVRAEAG